MKIRSFIASILISTFLFLGQVHRVYAQDWSDPSGEKPANFKDLEVVFSNVLGVLIGLAGVASFVMLIVGGYKYMLSNGDPAKASQARLTMTWAIVGVLFLIGAWFIIQLVAEFTGVESVTNFTVPGPTQ